MRKRCCVCGKLTHKYQRINGGPWHCYDNCKSTREAEENKKKVKKK